MSYIFHLEVLRQLEYKVPIELTNHFKLPSFFSPRDPHLFISKVFARRIRGFDKNGKVIVLNIPSSEKNEWVKLKKLGEAMIKNFPKNCIVPCWLKKAIDPKVPTSFQEAKEIEEVDNHLKELEDDRKQFIFGLLVVLIADDLLKTKE